MYDFTPLQVIMVYDDDHAEYEGYRLVPRDYFDVLPQIGDLFTVLWPDDEWESVEVIGRSFVSNWEFDDQSWVLIVKPTGPKPWEKAAFDALREMTHRQMEVRGRKPRDPDTEPPWDPDGELPK